MTSIARHIDPARRGVRRVLVGVLLVVLLPIAALAYAPTDSAAAADLQVGQILQAEDNEDVTWQYEVTSSGDARIVGYTPKNGVDSISIPETLGGHRVGEIASRVFAGDTRLVTVEFPYTIRTLGAGLFEGCTNLESLTGFGSIEELEAIPDHCFYGCNKLNNVSIPSKVSTIGMQAFCNCTGLKSFTFPPSGQLQEIGMGAFANCGLESLDLPAALTTIEQEAFEGCAHIASIRFRSTDMAHIGLGAFSGCTSLEELHLPDKLERLDSLAFAGCTALKSVSFGQQIPSTIGEYAFQGCDSIEMMMFPTQEHFYDPSQADMKKAGWTEDMACLTYYVNANSEVTISHIIPSAEHTVVTIPSTVGTRPITRIALFAARESGTLAGVVFPSDSHIEIIEQQAFMNCTALQSIVIPASVTTLGWQAFKGCTSLNNVTFKTTSLDTIAKETFYDCTSLVYVKIPEGTTVVQDSAFYNCTWLKTVVLPDSLQLVGTKAFSCDSGKHMTVQTMHMPNSQGQLDFPQDQDFWWLWMADGASPTFNFEVTYGSTADVLYLDPIIQDTDPAHHRRPLYEHNRTYVPVDINEKTGSGDDARYITELSWSSVVNYNGEEIKPTVTATRWLRTEPVGAPDYLKVEYPDSEYKSVGTHHIKVTGVEPYFKGERTLEFQIVVSNLDDVDMKPVTCVWDNKKWEPGGADYPDLKFYVEKSKYDFLQGVGDDDDETYELVKGTDYDITGYGPNKMPGTKTTIEITGKGNFTGTKEFKFTIEPASMSADTVQVEVPDQAYTGEPLTPDPATVKLKDRHGEYTVDLAKGADFSIDPAKCKNNTNVGQGQASMTLEPINGCTWLTGSVEAHFNIVKADLSQATVDKIPDQTYKGSGIEPELKVSVGGGALKLGEDYTVEWRNNVEVGTAEATIMGKDPNCEGSQTVMFQIVRRPVTVTPDNAGKMFGGEDPGLTATVDGVVGGDTVAYSLSREAGEKAGTYAITATGAAEQGNYAVTFGSGTFTIDPASIAGVEIAAIPNEIFDGGEHKPAPVVTWNGNALVENTDYTVSYANNRHAGEANVTVTGKGNFTDEVSATFAIDPLDISMEGCEVTVPFVVHTGDPLTPHPASVTAPGRDGATLTLAEDADYKILVWGRNVDVGTGHVVVAGTGDYCGTRMGFFAILNDGDLSQGYIDPIPDQEYTGEPIEPTLHVYLKGVDLVLRRGIDYEAVFEDNVEPGIAIPGGYSRARVTVTGIGDLHGELKASFRIVPPLAYALVKGPDGPVKQGTGTVAEFEFKRSYDDDTTLDHLTSVLLNGEELPTTAYDTRRGSAIVTLKTHYIDALTPGDFELTAVFDDGEARAAFTVKQADPVKYTVTFVDDDGTEISTASYPEGTAAADIEVPDDPAKPADKQYTYTFAGWSPEIADVTGDATYTATYEATPIPPAPAKAALTFDLGGGTLDGKTGTIAIEANVGDTIKLPGAPTREGYTFKYWKGSEYAAGADYKVEGDHAFTAEWEKDGASTQDKAGTKAAAPATGDAMGVTVVAFAISAIGSMFVLAACALKRKSSKGRHVQ